MCRERNCREMKKTGKSLFTFTSCLILLSVIGMLYTYMAGRKPEEGEDMAEPGQMADIEEDDDIFRLVGGYDNPIDEFYLPVIFASSGEDKVAVLKSYENAWKGQLEEYLEDYRSRCRYAKDKEMSEEYFAAVQMAADAQKELMDYMGVEADGQFWYSAQIYRCAFIKDVHGEFINEEANLGVMNVGLKEMQVPAGVNYEVCGGFVNDIDRQYAVSMYEGAEADIRCRQEAFDLDWCNELGTLTMEFYENLDEEGRYLAGIWQQSRETWKAAADVRFWRTPEELNVQPEDAVLCGEGINSALMEKDGWINRLYCQQLNSMMEKDSEKEGYTPIENVETLDIICVDGKPWQDIVRMTIAVWSERGNRYEIAGEEFEGLQSYLEHYYPGKEIVAEDFAKGELNGDGIEDMAITGLSTVEEGEKWDFRKRYVYLFIGKEDGSFIPLTPIESLEQGMGEPYGDRYEKIMIMDNMLTVLVSGGGNWRWGNDWRTGNFNVYQYEEGRMKEKWEVDLRQYAATTGMILTIDDKESNQWKQYAAVGEEEEYKELLLISEDTETADLQQEELDRLVAQFEEKIQKPIPKVLTGRMTPEKDSLYDYHICDYGTEKEPVWVLEKAAEEFLTKAQVLPAACYTSEEIKESYEKLIGVELPEQFYIGIMKEDPVLLYYNRCLQKKDGFVHELVLGIADEKEELWRMDCRIYYDENEETFRFGD